MKIRNIILWILLLALLMSACGKTETTSERKQDVSETAPAETAEIEEPPYETEIGEDGAMICDIGSWQSSQNETFRDVYDRINAGETADQLSFQIGSEAGTLEDTDMIFETFQLLAKLNVYTNHGYFAPEADIQDQFTFSWKDGLSYTFRFSEGGVFQTEDLYCFDSFAFVGDPDYEEICSTVLFLYEGSQPKEPAQQGEPKQEPAPRLTEDLDYDDGFFEWDADGDGNAEKFSVEFSRNGDEAPDVLIIALASGSELDWEPIYISGAYSIDKLESQTDKEGPSLLLSYSAGDYYSHDFPAQCRIRLRNGIFEVEEMKG